MSAVTRDREDSDDSAGGEEDLVGVDITEEPYAVRLERDLEPRHRQVVTMVFDVE